MQTAQLKSKVVAAPLKHAYDVVVVGGQLGGALAAALLAKRGHHVLLVEHDGMGHGYEHGGFLLPYAPMIAAPLKTMSVVDEAFVELGLSTVVQRTLKPHKPSLQLILPDHRVDLHALEAKRLAELSREFGAAGAGLNKRLKAALTQHELTDSFFKLRPNLPPSGMMEAWGLRRMIRSHPALNEASPLEPDDEATALLLELIRFVSYRAAPAVPLQKTRSLSQVLHAPSRFPGAKEAVRELLCRKLVDLGGDVLGMDNPEGSIVESFLFDGPRVSGVKLLKSEQTFRAGQVIASTDAGALRRLVTDKKRHRKLIELFDQSTTNAFLFTVNWVIRAEALPVGMGDLLLLKSQDAELRPLLVQVDVARRVTAKSDDEQLRVVCAGAFVPAKTRELGEAHLAQLAERIGQELDAVMPFAREQLLLKSAPYLDASGVRGSRLLAHPLFDIDTKDYLGVTGLPQRTPVKNLYLANREVLPGLGLEGEFLSGIRAARLVQESLKKKNLLKA